MTARATAAYQPAMPAQPRTGPVVLAAATFYAAFTLAALALHGWNPLWFVWIGERYANGDPHGHTGYDGQFIYYLARDGWAALPHLDNPPYRLQRILFPALCRLLSDGNAAAIAWLMVGINATAILTTTSLATGWLIRQGLSRWYGLVYPLFVGTFMSYSRDLTEPLAYGLAFAGALCWLGERRAAGVALLALAALARETTVLYAVGLGLAELARARWSRLAALAVVFVPLLAWQLYLRAQLGALPVASVPGLTHRPGSGILAALSLEPGRVSSLLFVGLPTLALTPLALRWVVRAPREPIGWLVAVHCIFGLQIPAGTYLHVLGASRNSIGLVLALLLALPRCAAPLRAAVAGWTIAPTAIWLAPVLWWAPWTAKL